ncbi:hypothetical protein ZWY2020_004062 [Hordeum vulgare]|nr:hypothetical protein ZWY2020_004062 [Hordeum vulgare]
MQDKGRDEAQDTGRDITSHAPASSDRPRCLVARGPLPPCGRKGAFELAGAAFGFGGDPVIRRRPGGPSAPARRPRAEAAQRERIDRCSLAPCEAACSTFLTLPTHRLPPVEREREREPVAAACFCGDRATASVFTPSDLSSSSSTRGGRYRVKDAAVVSRSFILESSASKHFLENKKGVDENVEHILRMIGEESELAESEPDDSGNTFKKSKLSSLVKGFHEDYQHLHKHCKDLISKLENVGHSSTGSDSSDSDSEGDRSDTDIPSQKLDALNEENGWMQKLAREHQGEKQSMEAEIQKLKQNAEEKTKEISELKKLLEKAITDKETTSSDVANLSSENEHLKLLVEGAEKEAAESLKKSTVMENEMRTLSGEKQTTENERDDLKILIVDLENKREDMSNQLQDTVEKCNSLTSQLEKAHLAEKEVQTLLSEIQKSKDENLMLSVECDNLKENGKNVDIKFSELRATLAETEAKNDSLIAENSLLESKLQRLGVEIDGMTVEREELMNNLNKERGAAEEEKLRLVSAHSKCLNELEKAQCTIKELAKEMESTKLALSDNIAELLKEKNSAASELKQLEASLKKLEDEFEQQLKRISVMQKDNEDLVLVNSNLHNELAAVLGEKNEAVASSIDLEIKFQQQNQQISSLQEAIEGLREAKDDMYNEVTVHEEEKHAAVAQLEQSEAYVKNLQSEIELKQNQISLFQQATEELQEKNSSLDRQLEEAKTNLQAEIILLQGEKQQAVDDLQQSNTSVKTLERKLEQQIEQNNILQLANEDLQKINCNLKKQFEDAMFEEAILKVSNLHEKLERVQAEAACQVNEMNSNAKDLEKIIDVLSSQKAKVEGDLKDMVTICMENLSSMNEFEDRVQQKVSDQATKLADLEQSLKDIGSNFQRLHHAYDDVSTEASQLEVVKKNHIEQINQLEEKNAEILDKHRHLEEEKFCISKDNAELQKHVQELEFQLKLAKQKLEVAEAESKCKEDSYVMAVETSKTEIVHLEEQIQLFSGRISLLEETFVQIKDSAASVVSKLKNQLDELESHSSQSITCLIHRLSACGGEFSVLQNMLHNYLAEQKELLKENEDLAIGLRKKEKEMSEMIKSATESAEKIVRLEKIIEEKDDELAARVQEKREAIKQLSDTIDYHKNNSDDLVRYIRTHNRPRLPFCL